MSTRHNDYWTDLQTIGSTTVLIEMTRFGLLWHGHAAKLLEGGHIDRNALAIAWGADQDQVFQDVLTGACISLEHREQRHQPSIRHSEHKGNGMFVMGCWRSFSHSADRQE
jgi:hypothetical protein